MILDVSRLITPGSLSDVTLLFSESPSRFLVEVPAVAKKNFEALFKGYAGCIGRVTKAKTLLVKNGRTQRTLIRQAVEALSRAWEAQE